jgi:hypothetical protein
MRFEEGGGGVTGPAAAIPVYQITGFWSHDDDDHDNDNDSDDRVSHRRRLHVTCSRSGPQSVRSHKVSVCGLS